jgi:hypothetical protein
LKEPSCILLDKNWVPCHSFSKKGHCFPTWEAPHVPCPLGSVLSLGAPFLGDGYYLAVGGAVAQHNWSHITTVLQDQKFRCQLVDSSEELGMISIQGPAR